MEGFKNLSITIDNKNYSIGNMYNMTMADLDYEQVKMVVELFSSDNKVLSEPAYTIIIVVYTVLVTIAGCGNSAVMFAVLRRKEMRTARNIFIFNLAMSDLLMATSIPFTVIDGLTMSWTLPNSGFACRYLRAEVKILYKCLNDKFLDFSTDFVLIPSLAHYKFLRL